MHRGLIALVAVMLAFVAMPVADAVPGIQCGEVIEESFDLEGDLLDCPGDGLVIGAKDITINLGGHRIESDGTEDAVGISNDDGYNGVEITNGTIDGFTVGVYVAEKGERVELSHLTLTGNGSAIVLIDSIESTVDDNVLESNGFGIAVDGDDNYISDNEIFASSPAILVRGNSNEISDNEVVHATAVRSTPAIAYDGDRNTVEENDVLAGGTGIEGIGSDNVLRDNRLEGGGGDGLRMDGSRNVVEKNVIGAYDGFGIRLIDDEPGRNHLLKNEITASGRDGVFVEADDVILESNEVNDNAGDGIQVDGSDGILEDNEADGNGGYGIRISGDGVTSDGNEADDNAAGDCRPASVCDH